MFTQKRQQAETIAYQFEVARQGQVVPRDLAFNSIPSYDRDYQGPYVTLDKDRILWTDAIPSQAADIIQRMDTSNARIEGDPNREDRVIGTRNAWLDAGELGQVKRALQIEQRGEKDRERKSALRALEVKADAAIARLSPRQL
ncbi:MAG: hypothetical protein GC136_03545 [Alphaproteobacteria bacterium]|nr:hypothetical protein [Alphaproteobacteria bacterium]